MPQSVELPNHETAEFPDDMPPEKISEVLRKQFPPKSDAVEAAVAKSQDNAYRSAVEATKAPNFGVDPVPPAAAASIPEGSLPNLQSLRAGKVTAEPKTSLRDVLSPILGERAAEEISKPAIAIGENVQGFVTGLPEAIAQVGKFAAEPAKTVSEALPGEVGAMQLVRNSKPFSQEWWNGVIGLGGQELGAIFGVRAGRAPKLAEKLAPVIKDLQPESPTPATDLALERTITDATQERQIQASVQPERQGDVTSRPPEETGAGGLVRPAAQGSAQEALVQPSTESPLASTAEPAVVSGTESPPAAVAPEQPIPPIPEDATASVKFKTPEGREVATEMNAREAEGIFTKERSSYQALLDCLGK